MSRPDAASPYALSLTVLLAFPAGASAAPSIDADGDGYTADVDCDDGDAHTFPGAPELCDGVRNDCTDTGWVSDAGLATFFSAADDTATDYTALLGAGTRDVPVTETLSEDGTLNICVGTWFAGLDVQASVDIVGIGSPELVILDGARQQPLVTATTSGTTVSLDGLTLRGGRSANDVTSSTGGAVKVSGIDSFSMTDVDLRRNQVKMPTEYYSTRAGGGASISNVDTVLLTRVRFIENVTAAIDSSGGGLRTNSCGLVQGEDLVFANNSSTYLGGAWLDTGSTIVVDGLHSANNRGIVWGGSIFLSGSTATIDDAHFIHDHSFWGGAVFLYDDATLDMDSPSFTDNAARESGGAAYVRRGTLTIHHGSFSGNLGGDVAASGTTYTFGSDDSVVCTDADGCLYTK